MGRTKIQLRKIENRIYRHITFSKRKSGLIKKAYELCVLCDIQIFVIIFSPAGKLFLYHGNTRVEEILKHLVDLPEQVRGRLNNVELIRRVIDQLTLESNIHHRLLVSPGQSVESQLEETKNELLLCNSELEQLEKEISHYIRNLSSMTTVEEVEDYEYVLEETLKHVQCRKQMLESSDRVPPAPLETFNPNNMNVNMSMNMSGGGFFTGSPSFNLNTTPPPQMEYFFGHRGFQHFSSQIGQAFPGPTQGYNFPQPNTEPNTNSYFPNPFAQIANDAYVNPHSQFQFLQYPNFNFPPRINSGEGTSMQGEMGSMNIPGGPMGYYNGTSHLGTHGNPFPF